MGVPLCTYDRADGRGIKRLPNVNAQRFQLQVDSPEDHDKTREYVWRRSNMIAHLVSQKLTFAAKSMLQPPPPQKTAVKKAQ